MSEFGTGLTYCLGLFLAHAERSRFKDDYGMWFNGAADHLFDLKTDGLTDNALKDRIKVFQNKCLDWRLDRPVTNDDYHWAIQEAKDLLRLIDSHFGIETEKGEWE